MSELSGAVVYGSAKLVAYTGYCLLGLKLAEPDQFRALSAVWWWRAIRLGALRWLLGLGIGVLVFFAFQLHAP
jgi:hypothetical protein